MPELDNACLIIHSYDRRRYCVFHHRQLGSKAGGDILDDNFKLFHNCFDAEEKPLEKLVCF